MSYIKLMNGTIGDLLCTVLLVQEIDELLIPSVLQFQNRTKENIITSQSVYGELKE
jgi:hypothetical protein